MEREHEMTPHCLTSQCVPCTIQVLVINLWEECYGVCVKSLAPAQTSCFILPQQQDCIDNCVFCHLAGVIYTVIVLILYIQGAASMVFVRVAEMVTMNAGGIGLATVKTFLEANINGLLLVDQNQDALDQILKQLSADELDRCDSFVADVSSERSNYVDYALQRWGRLDIAVLNAGIGSELNSILDTDVKIWDKIMEVNGRGGIPICRT